MLLFRSLGNLGDSRLATVTPVGDYACFALAYAAIAILLLEVDSGGDHLVGRTHYSAVGAGLRSPIGFLCQHLCHLGAGLPLREIPGEVFITLHK